jgi:NADH-quinone oxidoreductase subunit L
MRNMGGLRKRMPTTFWVYLIGSLALAGIPPLAGFWSKDEILAEALHLNPTVYWLLIIAAFFTAFYMGRQVLMVFFGAPRSEPAAHAVENPPVITLPLVILAGLSVLGGALNLPGLHTFGHWLEHTIKIEEAVREIQLGEEAAAAAGFNPVVAILATGLALVAIFLAYRIYGPRYQEFLRIPPLKRADDPLRVTLGPVFTGMEHKWWVDELYDAIIVKPYVAFSRFLADVIDWRFWHDWFHDRVIAGGFNLLTRLLSLRVDLGIIDAAADGLALLVQRSASGLRRIQNGFVRSYALSVFLGVVVILGYLILR